MGTIPTIDSDVLAAWLERDEAVLIDVREEPFYRAAHIPGARSIPFSRLDASTVDDTGGRRLVFNCELGLLSERAGERVRSQTEAEVFHLTGGIRAWKQAGKTTEGSGKGPIDVQRQVQIAAGSLVVLGSVLGFLFSPWWLLLSGFVGAGLAYAGATGTCGMAAVLLKLPHNRSDESPANV